MYKRKNIIQEKKLKSFKSKKSEHIKNAERIYKLDSIKPSKKLAEKTGCSLKGLQEIVKKGQRSILILLVQDLIKHHIHGVLQD